MHPLMSSYAADRPADRAHKNLAPRRTRYMTSLIASVQCPSVHLRETDRQTDRRSTSFHSTSSLSPSCHRSREDATCFLVSSANGLHIYIYIYIYRERERERPTPSLPRTLYADHLACPSRGIQSPVSPRRRHRPRRRRRRRRSANFGVSNLDNCHWRGRRRPVLAAIKARYIVDEVHGDRIESSVSRQRGGARP